MITIHATINVAHNGKRTPVDITSNSEVTSYDAKASYRDYDPTLHVYKINRMQILAPTQRLANRIYYIMRNSR